ncbi:MAG: hypothetical protein AB7S59_18255 [Parvibaculaceae bacterium]
MTRKKTPSKTSPTYRLFARAMKAGQQVLCLYDGHARQVSPVILGHSKGEEKVLVFQTAGGSSGSRLPAWKCFFVAKVSEAIARDGPVRSGSSHLTRQVCVEDVDLDINPESPYRPRRTLEDVR